MFLTVFGGLHITLVPERVIKRKEVDCIVIGEAEISFMKFLERKEDIPIKGVVYKKNGKLIGKFEEGIKIMLDNIDYWKDSPVWDKNSIKEATEEWFKYLSKNNSNSKQSWGYKKITG